MNSRLIIVVSLAGLIAGCVTTTPETVKTMSSEFLCEMLGPSWVTTGREQAVIRDELRSRQLACDYGHLRTMPETGGDKTDHTVPESSTKTIARGTCFAISPTDVLTSYHVVVDASRIEVRFEGKAVVEGAIARASRASDLAIIEVEGTPAHLPLAPAHSIYLGQQIFTLGFPATNILGDNAKYTDGTISSLSGVQGDASFFQMSVPVQPGNSGGPVVNMSGEAVGVVASTAAVERFYSETGALPQNINWASKIENAGVLTDATSSAWHEADFLGRAEVIENTKRTICRIRAIKDE